MLCGRCTRRYLFANAGESILAWVITGAKKVIDINFKIPLPKCVSDAIEAYRQENDRLGHFLDEWCELGGGLREKSGDLYVAYRNHCAERNEFVRSTTDFYAALDKAKGLKLHNQTSAEG